MTDNEIRLRSESKRLGTLNLTKMDDKQPYVFISYKSDDWREVLEDIVYQMQKKYGLRVYYDRNFECRTDPWYTSMQENMRRKDCLCVLAFYSEKYVSSYATMMELITSQGNKMRKYSEDKKTKEIIPIFLHSPYNLSEYISTFLDENIHNADSVHISDNEWEALQSLVDDCHDKTPDAVVTACQKLSSLKSKEKLTYDIVTDVFQSMESVITGNNRRADGSKLFFQNLKNTLENLEKAVYQQNPGKSVFDDSLICLEDLNIPKTGEKSYSSESEAVPAPEPIVSVTTEEKTSVPETQKQNADAQERKKEESDARKASAPVLTRREITPLEPYNGSGKNATFQDVRQRLSDEAQALSFRQFRESMPRGGKGAMDYVMAAALGGCNQITIKSPAWQINYYTQAVATLDPNKKKGEGLGATWTWSSNCRKLLGIEGAGSIPAQTDSYFKNLPEDTNLDWLEQHFAAQDPEYFCTSKPDLVLNALRRLMEYMEN